MGPHRVLVSCAAVGALALAPAVPATAAGHANHGDKGHGHGQRHRVTHQHGHGTDRHSRDRLAGPRGAAGHVLKAQAARLARFQDAVGADDTLNADDAAALLAALQSDLDALTGDLAAIPGATSVHELNAIKHAGVLTVTIAARQLSITVEADAIDAQAAERAGTVTDLAVQVAMAADTGHPVPAAEAAVEDAQSRLTVATSDARDALTAILAVSPSASRGDLQDACEAANEALLEAQNALAAVDADIATANTALGN